MHTDERCPLFELVVDRLEDRRRFQLKGFVDEALLDVGPRPGVRRLRIEDEAILADRALDVRELVLEELAQPELEAQRRLLILRRDQLELAPDRLGQLLPLADAEIDAIERLVRRQLLAVLDEDLAIRVDGAIWILELVLEQRRDPVADLALLVPVARQRQLLVVDLEQIVVALRLAVEALERLDRLRVILVEREDRGVGRERLIDVVELGLVDLTGHEQERQPIEPGQLARRGLVRLDQLGVGVGLARQSLEERPDRIVLRLLGEHLQVPAERRGLVLDRVLRQLGEAQHALLPLRQILGVAELNLEDRRELLGLLAALVERDQLLGR